jgi:hypothetical protein
VLQFHTDGFNRALQEHDYAALEVSYSDRSWLLRPDGCLLNKEQVLKDLRGHNVTFYPIELKNVVVGFLDQRQC